MKFKIIEIPELKHIQNLKRKFEKRNLEASENKNAKLLKMKKLLILLPLIISLSFIKADAQSIYSVVSSEMLFQWADVELAGSNITSEPPRYTCFFHLGNYVNFDLTDNIGILTGLAVRNVGFIYDEDIPRKTIRRSYTLGLPVAIKLGSFKNHLYVFGGGEYELLFHYKGKRWLSNDRDGTKIKDTGWFSNKTERFVPSFFVGIQFPGGVNVKFKKYLGDFLNKNYVGSDLGQQGVAFADYTKLDLYYISLSWQFRIDKAKDYVRTDDDKIAFRTY